MRFGGADATDGGRLADLENTLGLIGLDVAEYAPLLAPLVDIPLREDRRANFPREELRRRQLAAMTVWVLAGARSQPVALTFEDLHWADPTSLDLMARLAERGAQSPLLVIATTRPEFRAPWAMRSHHGVVSLAPLDRAQVRRMVSEIANRHALSDETIDGVGERTGGVPLFCDPRWRNERLRPQALSWRDRASAQLSVLSACLGHRGERDAAPAPGTTRHPVGAGLADEDRAVDASPFDSRPVPTVAKCRWARIAGRRAVCL
jgi:hypothetical protein